MPDELMEGSTQAQDIAMNDAQRRASRFQGIGAGLQFGSDLSDIMSGRGGRGDASISSDPFYKIADQITKMDNENQANSQRQQALKQNSHLPRVTDQPAGWLLPF